MSAGERIVQRVFARAEAEAQTAAAEADAQVARVIVSDLVEAARAYMIGGGVENARRLRAALDDFDE